jgi:hypothetical protein
MPGRQGQRVDPVIRKKVLPSVAQRQAPAAECDPARPAHLRQLPGRIKRFLE